MIRINLLPQHLRRNRIPVVKLVSLFAALISLLLVSLYAYQYWQIESQNRELSQLREKNRSYGDVRVIMLQCNEKIKGLDARGNELKQRQKKELSWPELMAHLTELRPPGLWFNAVASETAPASGQKPDGAKDKAVPETHIKINGLAVDYLAVMDFLDRLQQRPDLFSASQLLVVKQNDKNLPGVLYEITATVK